MLLNVRLTVKREEEAAVKQRGLTWTETRHEKEPLKQQEKLNSSEPYFLQPLHIQSVNLPSLEVSPDCKALLKIRSQ